MKKFFSTRNPVFNFFERFVDVAWTSILWLLFSLPIVTIGASSTALYYTATKVLRKKKSYIWREFFSGFKSNFRQATSIWMIYVLAMVFLFVDVHIMGAYESSAVAMLQFLAIFVMLLLTAFLIYATAYTARFEQTLKLIILNSIRMSFRHLPYTLLLLLIFAAAVVLVYFMGIAFLIVPAVTAWIDSIILENIFRRYMTPEEQKLEEEDY